MSRTRFQLGLKQTQFVARTTSDHFDASILKISHPSAQLEFKGVAESNGAVSDFMRKLEASDYMGKPQLVIIENKDRGREKRREFTVKAMITPPKLEPAEGAPTAGGAKG